MHTTEVSSEVSRKLPKFWTAIFRPAKWSVFFVSNKSDKATFRVRDPERDKNTDRDRSRRLIQLLEQLAREVESERDGLAKRLKADTGDAAFLMDAAENNDADTRELNRMDSLERAIIHAETRIRALDDQLEKLQTMIGVARQCFEDSKTLPGTDKDPETVGL